MTDPLVQRAVEFVQNPTEAVKDFREILDAFGAVFREHRNAELGYPETEVNYDDTRTPIWLAEIVSKFAKTLDLAARQRAEPFSGVDMNMLRRFRSQITFPTEASANMLRKSDGDMLFDTYLRVWDDYTAFAEKVTTDAMSLKVEQMLSAGNPGHQDPVQGADVDNAHTGTSDKSATQAKLKPCELKAWSQMQAAVRENPELKTDDAIYDYYSENMAESKTEMAKRGNWKRYIRSVRGAFNQPKNGPRIGNETRSVVSAQRIE